jgi:GTPase
MAGFKSGFVTILGRPNVGKSTLFNRIVGEKVAIVSRRPQTTRNRILGIRNLDQAQIVLLDTPGIHEARSELDHRMIRTAWASGSEADLVLFLTEASLGHVDEDRALLSSLKGPAFLVLNKIDLIRKPDLLPIIDQYRALYSFEKVVPISASGGDGVDVLLDAIADALPEAPAYYPQDILTDQTERFLASEIIRENAIRESYQEIPYATAVTIEEFKERPGGDLAVIKATIHVEKPSQKKILIGRGGQKLKQIGVAARKEIEAVLDKRIYLELWVNVEKNWTRDPRALERLGYPYIRNRPS